MKGLTRINFIHSYFLNLNVVGCLLLILMFSQNTRGQQEWGYSQYLFNLFDVNGAYAGNHEAISTALRYRKQWIGFDGAPETQTFSIHTPLSGPSTAAGLRIKRENIGARSTLHTRLNGTYKFPLGDGRLGVGITVGLLHQSLNTGNLNVKDGNDPYLGQGNWTSNTPTVDFAVLYSSDKYYLGFESNGINRQSFKWTESSIARLYMQMMITGGVMKKVGSNDLIHFSALGKISEGQLYQAEASASFLLNNKVWIGAGYRIKYGVVMFTEWNINKQIRLGYSFDVPTGYLSMYESGSHEIFLGITFGNKKPSSIRYF